MAITTGTRVTTKDGITGTVVSAPALTSSGYVVRVEFDAAFAHRSPVGSADYNTDDLTEETTEAATPQGAERAAFAATCTNALPLAETAVRSFARELPLGGALRVSVVPGAPEAVITRDDLYALACSAHTTPEATARIREAVATHVRYGARPVHMLFPARGMRPALYLGDLNALLNHH